MSELAMPCKDHGKRGNNKGYALARYKNKVELVHRVVYCQTNGAEIESIRGLVVRHACDNSRCIEPSHLLLGTQSDNVRDMIERGRGSKPPISTRHGSQNPMSKLDYQKAIDIRSECLAGATQKDLARKFGVSQSLISFVVNNKIWPDWLCEINLRLSPLAVTADMLVALGFNPAGNEGAAKLYKASDYALICEAIIHHVQVASASHNLRKAA